jgi:peptidoglycan/xylan/chitin deacetylase (PgdA/CDA1 family)
MTLGNASAVRASLALALLVAIGACRDSRTEQEPPTPALATTQPVAGAALAASSSVAPSVVEGAKASGREANELGRIPVLEYHLIGDSANKSMWVVEPARFRQHLELLYERGYRPFTVSELVDGALDLPAGMSPVVFTFDDASPSQFRYIEKDGVLEIDPTSAVGIWLDFARTRPDWRPRATFCLLPTAQHGHAFFGEKDIQGQKSEWRLRKVKWLAENGFELCNHTLYHVNLGKASDSVVQEQIARGVMAIDSAVPGYRVRAFALPLGVWPKNRELARKGSWREPRSGRVVSYEFDAILEVAGGPAKSPHDPTYSPLSIKRFIVFDRKLEELLEQMDRQGTRYVSDGDPSTVARPPVARSAARVVTHSPGSIGAESDSAGGRGRAARTRE